MTGYEVVIPSIGRPELARLLLSLEKEAAPPPQRLVIVDDRPGAVDPPPLPRLGRCRDRIRLLRSGGRGPAAARNLGWRACASEWVVFLDDDVVLAPGWGDQLQADLQGCGPETVGVQGRIVVPLAAGRPATDWERNVAGLATARWATADMAYRRQALELVGGFDERFPRAYREDADLALRLHAHGLALTQGSRRTIHPVGEDRPRGPLRRQAGNADDVLMLALHGRRWREKAQAPRGRRPWHLATTIALVVGLLGRLLGRGRLARIGAVVWMALTADFARRRIAPGPKTWREVARGGMTSLVIPPLAIWHWLRGWVRLPVLLRSRRDPPRPGQIPAAPLAAVLFDRDGTLIADEPYCADPDRVRPLPGAGEALAELRRRGVLLGVVTNQSGIGRGLVAPHQVEAVNRRVDELLGPFDTWSMCPHRPEQGCDCRKPAPGLVLEAARRLGVRPHQCLLVGDIGSDMEAARRAGAVGLLVPTWATRPEEVAASDVIAADLKAAVRRVDRYLPSEQAS